MLPLISSVAARGLNGRIRLRIKYFRYFVHDYNRTSNKVYM